MSAAGTSGWSAFFAHNRGLIFPVLIVTAVLILVAPLPPMILDLLLACNVTVAVVIFLTTIYVARPLEFRVFPTILLGTTLVRNHADELLTRKHVHGLILAALEKPFEQLLIHGHDSVLICNPILRRG